MDEGEVLKKRRKGYEDLCLCFVVVVVLMIIVEKGGEGVGDGRGVLQL